MEDRPILWTPQEKQEFALKRTEDEILFGGARGGGKTDTGISWLLYDESNPLYRALVIRRNADDLKDWCDRADRLYSKIGFTSTGGPKDFVGQSGCVIRTGHLKDESAYTKYQGHEYQKMLIEELTHISSEDRYEKLLGSNRSTVDGIKPQLFATCNPDGPGFNWVKKRWKIPDNPTESIITTRKTIGFDGRETIKRLIFIPSRVEDNKILMEKDPGYVAYLDSITDPDLRKAWREGSWTGISIKGAYYAELLNELIKKGRNGFVPYDPLLKVHTVWDLGVGDATSIIFVQVIGLEVRIIDYYEFNGVGLDHYAKVLQDRHYVYGSNYAPHDIEVRELSTGKTRRELAEGLGIKFDVVPNIPIEDGIEAGRKLFKRLFIDNEHGEQLVSCLSQYRKEWDEKLGRYKDHPLHDWTSNGADAYRYLAVIVDDLSNGDFTRPITTSGSSSQDLYDYYTH